MAFGILFELCFVSCMFPFQRVIKRSQFYHGLANKFTSRLAKDSFTIDLQQSCANMPVLLLIFTLVIAEAVFRPKW